MYSPPGYRGQKKNQRKKQRHFPSGRCKRVNAEIQRNDTNEVIEGNVFLHDLTPDGVGFFSDTPLQVNEPITLVIRQPRHLYIKGKVKWSALRMPDPKVISAQPMRYRIGVQFEYDAQEDRDAIKSYCDELSLKAAA